MPLPRPTTLGAIHAAREAASMIRRSARPRRLRRGAGSARGSGAAAGGGAGGADLGGAAGLGGADLAGVAGLGAAALGGVADRAGAADLPGAADLVDVTGLRVERHLRAWLKAAHPGHAVVGGHHGGLAEADLSGPTWFLNPVDGAANLARGIPHCACSIAFWDGQRLVLAVVADVARRRTYWAEAGRGAYEGHRRLRASPVRRLDRAVLATGFPGTFTAFDTFDTRETRETLDGEDNLAEFTCALRHSRDLRRTGSTAIDLAWIAAGRLDCYWEQRRRPCDWAAGVLLVREAGGKATTYAGLEWHPGDADLVATNGPVHPALIEAFVEARAAAGLPVRPPQPGYAAVAGSGG